VFTLAHLSDPHIAPLPFARPWALCSKRVLGYLSWNVRRKTVHTEAVLGALSKDLRESAPDHIAVTGDITNIALPEEFRRAGAWLDSLGPADRVSVIPGNHDAYTRIAWSDSMAYWRDFMTSDRDANALANGAVEFPFLRIRGNVAVIGVSTALPTLPFLATGEIGTAQMSALEGTLFSLAGNGMFRVVLVHHPPVPGVSKARKRLVDAEAFRDVIARAGAELILHGHTHRSSLMKLDTPGGHAPVVGITSASANENQGPGRHARYNLYRIPDGSTSAEINVEVRGFDPDSGSFRSERSFTL
jgi:3',5'-cyclic AMP phosphodiesterase CpdA